MTDKEIALELTKAWLEFNAKIVDQTGASKFPNIAVKDVQGVYQSFLATAKESE
jgi:hypothetical protein